jgi:hypothetical protein
MHRQEARIRALRTATLLALAAALLAPAGALARTHAAVPGHFRGIVTANTPAGHQLARQLATRGAGFGLVNSANNLQYNGGTVMHSDANYAIYWEPSGYSTTSTYKSIVGGYFTNVAAASGATNNNYSVATQYYDSSGKIAYSATSGGSVVDTDPYPSRGCVGAGTGPCINDTQLQTEVSKVVAAHGWPTGLGAEYFVYFPQGVTTCTSLASYECSGTVYCAYHSSMGSGSSTILYANMPYDGVSGCDSGEYPNGNQGADDELNVTSHENIETITDPLGNAWYDASGQEIGDKCNFTFGSPLGGAPGSEYNEQISTGKYWLQEEWSNAASGCVQRP